MPATMADGEWYAKFNELNQRLDAAQRAASDEFVRWSANSQDEIPPSAQVDELQEELSQHMEIAPDDEPEDDRESKLRGERFAQEQPGGAPAQSPCSTEISFCQSQGPSTNGVNANL